MGQYYKLVNLRDRQALSPSACGDGLKLMEFGMSGLGTLSVLAAALAHTRDGVGPWAGAPLVVTGDYADEGRFLPPCASKDNLYGYVHKCTKMIPADKDDTPCDASVIYQDTSEVLRDHLCNTFDLEVRERVFGRASNDEVPAVIQQLARMKSVDCLEDLIELFDGTLCPESATTTAESLFRGLRVKEVDSPISWQRVVGYWITDVPGSLGLGLRAFDTSQRLSEVFVRLTFPMSPLQVARHLQFEAQLSQALDEITPAAPAGARSADMEVMRPDVGRRL